MHFECSYSHIRDSEQSRIVKKRKSCILQLLKTYQSEAQKGFQWVERCDRAGRWKPYLSGFPLNPVHNSLEGGLAEPALRSGFLVGFEAAAHALGAIVVGVTERLVNGLDGIPSSHEDL